MTRLRIVHGDFIGQFRNDTKYCPTFGVRDRARPFRYADLSKQKLAAFSTLRIGPGESLHEAIANCLDALGRADRQPDVAVRHVLLPRIDADQRAAKSLRHALRCKPDGVGIALPAPSSTTASMAEEAASRSSQAAKPPNWGPDNVSSLFGPFCW
jgi:hypothetical protein